jgi:hypothetical protein
MGNMMMMMMMMMMNSHMCQLHSNSHWQACHWQAVAHASRLSV